MVILKAYQITIKSKKYSTTRLCSHIDVLSCSASLNRGTHLLDFLFQPLKIQGIKIPLAGLIPLAVGNQLTQVRKVSTAVVSAAKKELHLARVHTWPQCACIGVAKSELRMHIDLHIDKCITPLSKAAKQHCRIGKSGTPAGFKVGYEAGPGPHGSSAAPARHTVAGS